MQYFCYISRTKVDQLYAHYFPGSQDEWIQTTTASNELSADASVDWSFAKIINLFKGGVTYGRKGVIQRESKVKIQYNEKLKKVLLAISNEQKIMPLTSIIKGEKTKSSVYSYEGKFQIETPVNQAKSDDVITVTSTIDNTILKLDCSLRFFSEGNEQDNNFLIHSGNMRFFSGQLNLQLSTVFLVLGRDTGIIFGTPLFLMLDTDDFFIQL